MAKEKVTPLMQQFFDIKKNYQDTLLFFQVGDFYELFFDDAKIASSFLAIALTKRGKNKGKDIPLCGIPIHALNHYLKKLISGGFKVAICDQLTKPEPGKVVERGVTQVFTPGTLTDSTMLDDKSASYLLSFYPGKDSWGLIFSELLTAQLFATKIPAGDVKLIESELIRFFPDEIVIPEIKTGKPFTTFFKQRGYCASLAPGDWAESDDANAWVESQFSKKTLQTLGENPTIMNSLSMLHHYLKRNQEKSIQQFRSIQFYEPEDYLILDPATQKNLEIVKNNEGGSKNTLFSVIDHAKTSMGSRTLKKWLLRPLMHKDAIVQRQEVVQTLYHDIETSQKLEKLLGGLADLERIIGRIALRRAQVQDYLALKESLTITPSIKTLIHEKITTSLGMMIHEKIGDFSGLTTLLEQSLHENNTNNHIIKKGFDHQLDHLRNLVENGQQELLKLEQHEREKTGINSLKVGFNRVSGYYLEVTNPNLSLVPEYFQEQQKLSNRKRFVTQELKNLEHELFKAQNEIDVVEANVFNRIKDEVETFLAPLRALAQALSYLDGLYSLATVAYNNNYVAPIFNDTHEIIIKEGRHPVIETKLGTPFVHNDTLLNNTQSLLVITGPNMGGKSTYLRQVALISILAQCGSFVPATQATLPLLDRVFTRIGSADNLAEGKSTFLVEMEETATICNQATKQSLVILDEVGRGTSTHDGIALAQAIIEYIVHAIQAKCLFATHYHELTELEKTIPVIKNYSLKCKKIGDQLHFLHEVSPGIAGQSFGLDVAKLAHLPDNVVSRAQELLASFHAEKTIQPATSSSQNTNNRDDTYTLQQENYQLVKKIEKYREYIDLIKQNDLNQLSPKQAFDLLWQLSEQVPD